MTGECRAFYVNDTDQNSVPHVARRQTALWFKVDYDKLLRWKYV